MSITFRCSCGKELEVFDSLAGQKWKCRQCGTWNVVPTKDGGAATAAAPASGAGLPPGGVPVAAYARPTAPASPVAPPPAAIPVAARAPKASEEPPSGIAPIQEGATCEKCRKPIPRQYTHCPNCGWDAQADARRCVGCGGFVAYDYAGGFVYSTGVGAALMMGYNMFLQGWKAGLLGDILASTGIVCFVTALGGLMALLTLQFKCAKCDKHADLAVLTPDERNDFRKKRAGFLIGTIALAAVAVLCGLGWYGQWKGMRSSYRFSSAPGIENTGRGARRARMWEIG